MNDEKIMMLDHMERAQEVLKDLAKDGYPSDAQWSILCMAICEVIASDADQEEHLREEIEYAKYAIECGSKFAFKQGRNA